MKVNMKKARTTTKTTPKTASQTKTSPKKKTNDSSTYTLSTTPSKLVASAHSTNATTARQAPDSTDDDSIHDSIHDYIHPHTEADANAAVSAFILYRAFDALSAGDYTRLVAQCTENGDPWAEKVNSQVNIVQSLIRRVQAEITTLEDYGKTRLRRVCLEVVNNMTPPTRRSPGWSICSITGVRTEDCIDVSRNSKTNSSITVDKRFSHFLIMLWLVVKFEHVCKIVTRSWLQQQNARAKQETAKTSHQEPLTVHMLCAQFEKEQQPTCLALQRAFMHGYTHVIRSLRMHIRSSDTQF